MQPPHIPQPGTTEFLISAIPDLPVFSVILAVIMFGSLGGLISHMYRVITVRKQKVPRWFGFCYSIITGICVAFFAAAIMIQEIWLMFPAVMLASGMIGRIMMKPLISAFEKIGTDTLDRFVNKKSPPGRGL